MPVFKGRMCVPYLCTLPYISPLAGAPSCAHELLIFVPIQSPIVLDNFKVGCSWDNKQRHLVV